MASTIPRPLIEVAYYEAAQEYLRDLPPEHFMEATAQGTQRKITLESFDLVHARRPDVQIFNELLVQYPRKGERRPGQVVPDNMVVVWAEPIKADGSCDTPLQPVGPFWVLEYVSKYNKRKDYEDNHKHYETALKVPYFLLFFPDSQDLTLYRHNGKKCVSVPPDNHGRHPIPDLEMEVGLLNEWLRFWYKGEFLPLPGDMQRELDEIRHELAVQKRRSERETKRADQEKLRADEVEQAMNKEREARLTAERELEELRARLAARPPKP
ncbi:MAG: Uma2 family endonuclease [Planctomycetes bacterium]|nr:Uma2 family endonuclease [Planctomycetota bacterium]